MLLPFGPPAVQPYDGDGDGEHILKATAILHLANSDRCATPPVFRDSCRSYSILVLEIKLSYSHMQSQNLLRLFISVLFLTAEDFFSPAPEYFLSKLKLLAADPVQWEHCERVVPFLLQSLLKRTDIH